MTPEGRSPAPFDPVKASVTMRRAWAMPNHNTFEIEPIAKFIGQYIGHGSWIDPFARNSRFARYCRATNDINAAMATTHNLEALDFLGLWEVESFDGVIFDPPYSPRQISEAYAGAGIKAQMSDTQSAFWSARKDAIAKLVKPGGVVLSFGWNSNGMGHNRGFELSEILMVAHGGAHNDTICLAETKRFDLFSREVTA